MPLGPCPAVSMDVPPYGLSGTLYGVLLNHQTALQALGDVINQPPYQGAPKSPVLYIKPRNTLAVGGEPVAVPPGVAELEVGATLGLVIGRPACRLSEESALEHVAGYLIVNDVSIPHRSYYRPSIRFKARDGFCPLGPRVVPRAAIANPDALTIRVYLDGELRQTATTAQLMRPVAKLLADVTDFMTLSPGDVLTVGAAAPAPRARAGQVARIEIDGLGRLENPFVDSAA
ncbi:MAG: 2-hydroxyhepta-2,4-diene-1,7-dioate isomerase [Gammaproteobacteria bacterium]|nr:MAG: 2-hydroxyhepta-2,4-diene-1,7-dioate isomerase [Gammaproteobacteria bacterium]